MSLGFLGLNAGFESTQPRLGASSRRDPFPSPTTLGGVRTKDLTANPIFPNGGSRCAKRERRMPLQVGNPRVSLASRHPSALSPCVAHPDIRALVGNHEAAFRDVSPCCRPSVENRGELRVVLRDCGELRVHPANLLNSLVVHGEHRRIPDRLVMCHAVAKLSHLVKCVSNSLARSFGTRTVRKSLRSERPERGTVWSSLLVWTVAEPNPEAEAKVSNEMPGSVPLRIPSESLDCLGDVRFFLGREH